MMISLTGRSILLLPPPRSLSALIGRVSLCCTGRTDGINDCEAAWQRHQVRHIEIRTQHSSAGHAKAHRVVVYPCSFPDAITSSSQTPLRAGERSSTRSSRADVISPSFHTAKLTHSRACGFSGLWQIMLRHNQITGSRYVILDGLEIPGSRGRTAIVSAVEIGFKVRGAPGQRERYWFGDQVITTTLLYTFS